MNMMMFPRMVVSRNAGWTWLMDVHPDVRRMFVLYVMPMSLLPAAMMLYTAESPGGAFMFGNLTMGEALLRGVLFYLAELAMVPLMAFVMQYIGRIADAVPEYHDAFAFAAVVPTPLWLSSLAMFIPSLGFNALVSLFALILSVALIYEGTYRTFRIEDAALSHRVSAMIIAAGLVAWAALMGLAFAGWDWVMA